MSYFYFKKHAQRNWKRTHTYFQTFGKFTSRLASISERGSPKFGKLWRRYVEFRDPKFLNEKKNQGVRCKKPFANWLRVSGWKLIGTCINKYNYVYHTGARELHIPFPWSQRSYLRFREILMLALNHTFRWLYCQFCFVDKICDFKQYFPGSIY